MKKTEKLVLTAMMVSLAVVIDLIMKMIPLLDMPQGGSFNLNMLPLFLLAYILGPVYGILGGVCFGMLNFFLDGADGGIVALILDYVLAFGALGLAGFFKKALKGDYVQFVSGIVVCCIIRFFCSTLSGVIVWETPWVGSMAYNGGYMLASMLGVIALGLLIYKPISRYVSDHYYSIANEEKQTTLSEE